MFDIANVGVGGPLWPPTDPPTPAEIEELFEASFEALVREMDADGGIPGPSEQPRSGRAAEWLRRAPGAVTAEAMKDCASHVADLPDDDVLELAAAAQRLTSWACSVQLAAMAELYRRSSTPPPIVSGASSRPADAELEDMARRSTVAEVALACGLSEYAAGQRMNAALQLSRRLPATFDALAAGRLDWPKVQAITEATAPLPEAAAARVEQVVLPDAGAHNLPALRRALARAVIDVDPAPASERAERARSERRVVFTAHPGGLSDTADGMCELWALLPVEGAMRAKAGLDALARGAASPGDGRTADQRRADVLVDVLTAGADGPGAAAYSSGVRGGLGVRRLPEVVVTVSAETLLGLSEDPGHLSGYGPIVADLARDVAARGTWRCAIVDGTHGTLLGLGRTTFTPDYRPGQPLVDHVAVRDQTCSFPGCHQAARRCDADHRRPHPAGATCECNIGSLCRHHHRLKHRSGFEVETSSDGSDPPGTLIWTTPTGRTYSRPPTRMPAATPDRSPPAGPVTHRAREEVEEEDPPPF